MAQSEKQRQREKVRYWIAGLAAWLPVIVAKDIIHQHVPPSLETPFLVVVVTGSCLLGLAGFREGVYNSRPNRAALLIGLGSGALYFSLSIALPQRGLGQACGVLVAFWIVMMAAAVQSSSKLSARFRASFPAPASPAPVLSVEMRHFLEESAMNDPDAYVIYPDRAGIGPAYQAPSLTGMCTAPRRQPAKRTSSSARVQPWSSCRPRGPAGSTSRPAQPTSSRSSWTRRSIVPGRVEELPPRRAPEPRVARGAAAHRRRHRARVIRFPGRSL